MAITIQKVVSEKGLKEFIRFPNKLYKGNPFYVPAIMAFELSTLSEKQNPAFDHCEASYWLAYKDGKIAGRIAGILQGQEIEDKPIARFGWVDFIDDNEIFDILIDTVTEWAQSKGLSFLHGPLGFTDLDFEGLLISGFDQLATQATIYNHPYYQAHFERSGFTKACDWVEVRGTVPTELPKRLSRTASMVSSRFKLRVRKIKSVKEILQYSKGIFKVLNNAYSHLYGYYPLTEAQIDYYVKQYFGFVRKEFVTIIVDEHDEVAGFAVSFPSLSLAFQKAKGSLYPFGFLRILKAFYSNKHVDMFLIGVSPKYQKLGANVLIFHEMLNNYINQGVEYVSTGPMLEDNWGVLNLWHDYKENLEEIKIRRRCFIKSLDS